MAFVGLRWQSLAVMGLRWPWLVDCHGPVLTHGLALAFGGLLGLGW